MNFPIEKIEQDVLNSEQFHPDNFPVPCGRDTFYRKCTSFLTKRTGLFLEFGVYQGGTINFLSSLLSDKKFYGFDSFQGLPEDWKDIVPKNHFKTEIPNVNSNVELVIGLFDKTLDIFLKKNQNKTISFVHLDADIYSSINYVLQKIENKIENNCLFIFDDFLNFPNYKDHSIKCFSEFLERTGYSYTTIGYVKEDFSRCAFLIKTI